MRLVDVTDEDRRALDAAQRTTRRVREWRRLQAVRLLADGQEAPAGAPALGGSASSVYYWATDWREAGVAGLADGPHDARPRRLDADAAAPLAQVLADDPHAQGYVASAWPVPLLRSECARRGHALRERTLRRTLHRLGFRCKRPKYVLGRPDPAIDTYEANKGR